MTHSVFEYLYRDAANFKAWGELLLEGKFDEADLAGLLGKFEGEEFFIAEQIGVPTLYEALWRESESDPSEELDHVWHQFNALREATEDDVANIKPWGSVGALLEKIGKVQSWDIELSRNWNL